MKGKFFIFFMFLTILFPSLTHAEDKQKESWGIEPTKVDKIWNLGITGKGINVAVIDMGGVFENHEDLKGQILRQFTCSDIIDAGCQQVLDHKNYHYDHGTEVSGILAAKDNQVGTKGVAYNSKLVFYDVSVYPPIDAKTTLSFDKVYNALRDIYERNSIAKESDKIKVINMSIRSKKKNDQTGQEKFPKVEEMLKKLSESGVIVVAGTGNDNQWCENDKYIKDPEDENKYKCEKNITNPSDNPEWDNIGYPASSKYVISVGAVKKVGEDFFQRSEFSSTGPKIEVVAPGSQLIAPTLPEINSYNTKSSGTSISSPFVAGIFALYKEMLPHYSYQKIINKVLQEARPMEGIKNDKGEEIEYGRGLVQTKITPEELYVGITSSGGGELTSNMDNAYKDHLVDDSSSDLILQPNEELTYTFNDIAWDDVSHFFLQLQMRQQSTLFEHTPIKSDEITNFLNNNNLTLTIYDSNKNILTKQKLEETGWNSFKENYKDVASFGIKNEGSEKIGIAEFDLHGKSHHSIKKVNVSQTIFFTGGEKKFYNSVDLKDSLSKTDLKGVMTQSIQATDWNKEKKRFDWYQITVPEKGIKNLWYKPIDAEINPIYMDGIFDKTEGKLVRSSVYDGDYKFNDNENYNSAWFRGNKSEQLNEFLEYRFVKPVSFDSAFLSIGSPITELDSNFQMEFLSEDKKLIGSYKLNESDTKQEFFKLPQPYQNVSRIILRNLGREDLKIGKLEFFDTQHLNSSLVELNKEVSLKHNSYFTLYDEPFRDARYSYKNFAIGNIVQMNKGYMWDHHLQQYRWYLLSSNELSFQNKWTQDSKLIVKQPYEEGIIDKNSLTLKESTGMVWSKWFLFDNDLWQETLFTENSSLLYDFEQPVEIKSVYIYGINGRTDPNFSIELLDQNGNVLVNHFITEEEWFNSSVKLSDTPLQVKSFRLKNNSDKSGVNVSEIEFFN